MATKAKVVEPDDDGFDVEAVENILVLNFDDPAYSRLRVRMREPSAGQLEDMLNLAPSAGGSGVPGAKEAKMVFDLLDGGLIDWNARRLGAPVPPDRDGIRSMGMTFIIRLLDAWLAATDAFHKATAEGVADQGLEISSLPMDTPLA